MTEKNTKIMKSRYNAYLKSDKTSLLDCYTTYSNNKASALNHCHAVQNYIDGKNGRIISYNGWAFTYGFTYADQNNGQKYFVYITKDNISKSNINKLSNIIL